MKILVPVDGSPASIRAVRLAIDQVKGAGTAPVRPRLYMPKEGVAIGATKRTGGGHVDDDAGQRLHATCFDW